MKLRIKTNTLAFAILVIIVLPREIFAAEKKYSNLEKVIAAKNLGWIDAANPYNICHGYYRETPIIVPAEMMQAPQYTVNAQNFSYSIKEKRSEFSGGVTVVQQNSQLEAQRASVITDEKTSKAKYIDIYDKVRFSEVGRLILATSAHINVPNDTILLTNITYRMTLGKDKTITTVNPKTKKRERRIYQLNAWGKAKSAKQIKPKLFELISASYTTCPPNSKCWKLLADKIVLNRETGRGYATHAKVYVNDVPVFYWPYFNFPIDKRRQTGFLTPTPKVSGKLGATLELPYYWNLAPNYDLTTTPAIMQKRGFFLGTLFRYLTPQNNGKVLVDFVPYDETFKDFQQQNDLNNSNSRYSVAWHHNYAINDLWTSVLDFNHVSDDYFMEDFSTSWSPAKKNHLLRQLQVNYNDQTWNFLAGLQAFQTLHPITQSDIDNQYARLPQIKLSGLFPHQRFGFNYGIQGEFVRFDKQRNPFAPASSPDPVNGNRVSARPSVSLPMIGRFASLTPRAQVQLTQYDLTNAESNGFPSTPNMAVPIFDVNGSLYFDRKVNFLSQNLIQTLEPKIYYLFVPFQHQDNPTFDTYLQSFNYDYMFLDNRFSGIDRIGDTNQVTLALATKFLEENSGFERASASIGQIRYFKNRRVQLTNNNEVNTSDASSIAAKATYNLTPHWSAVGEASLNSESNKFDSNSFTIRYQPEKKRFINVSYNFVRLGDKLVTPTGDNNDSKVDLKQTDVYAYWRLTEQYNLLARWNYNWGQQRAQAFLYGIEYQSCCWAVRVGGERRFMGINPNNDFIFDNMFFIQFELKGLGVVGQGPSTKGASTLEDSIKNLFV